MLSSITPLGQRSRQGSWVRTIVAFVVGALIAGFLVFGSLGLVGDKTDLASAPIWVSILVLAVAAGLDTLGVPAPGPRRQVNEDWLGRYRDWVTGLGFGVQLGAGFFTIVPAFAVWALLALALLNGLPLALVIGAGFAIGRWLLLLSTRGVSSPTRLAQLMGRFASLEHVASRTLLAGYGAAIVLGTINVL